MIKLSSNHKIYLTSILFFVSIVGFMFKLPAVFRHHDKELHFLFYFFAAAFFNFLFRKKHLLIFFGLLGFGIFIELFQSFSNRFYSKRIHGDFDSQDVYANLSGLILFSVVWSILKIISFIFKKLFK